MSVDVVWKQQEVAAVAGDYALYRSLNTWAVISAVSGVLSLLGLLSWWLLAIPLAGMAAGFISLRQIRARPEQYTGELVALSGTLVAALLLVADAGWLTFSYVTEVPPDHLRLTYDDLQPTTDDETFVPPAARELDGKKVFIKGYVYQPKGGQTEGLKHFVLVRDRKQCCFGGNPKVTDMIQVRLKGKLEAEFNMQPRALAGTFHVRPSEGMDGLGDAIYQLEADYLK
jgi:hypothetical protein